MPAAAASACSPGNPDGAVGRHTSTEQQISCVTGGPQPRSRPPSGATQSAARPTSGRYLKGLLFVGRPHHRRYGFPWEQRHAARRMRSTRGPPDAVAGRTKRSGATSPWAGRKLPSTRSRRHSHPLRTEGPGYTLGTLGGRDESYRQFTRMKQAYDQRFRPTVSNASDNHKWPRPITRVFMGGTKVTLTRPRGDYGNSPQRTSPRPWGTRLYRGPRHSLLQIQVRLERAVHAGRSRGRRTNNSSSGRASHVGRSLKALPDPMQQRWCRRAPGRRWN